MKDVDNKHLKTFLAGGIAGMASKTTVAPLDRVKILLQAHNTHYKHNGVFSGLRDIVRREKFSGLYRGNGAQMVRVFPYAAVQFFTFEIYKKHLLTTFGNNHFLKLFAGSGAGITAVIMTYPLDLVRARLSFSVEFASANGATAASGYFSSPPGLRIWSCIRNIVQNEGGFAALYRGMTPALLGIVPYSGLYFYTFEEFKRFVLEHFPHWCGTYVDDKLLLNIPSKLLCGGLSGAVSQSLSYPLDVARRRMQLSMMQPETYKYSKGVLSTLIITYKEHGIVSGLYRGMSINYLRAIPMVAASFTTYEIIKQYLGLDTSINA
ncbi:graves disease carrier protein [Tetranychus urticae]|uniref:Uncharacterized protein n=1 Tax=Tetranychus urticae TaxID=32264 RepID=A0A158P5J0_TETUR|nr:graves disease carrier protein [Tetranychus urticae]